MKNGINKKLLFLIAFLLIGMMFVVYVTYAYYIAEAIGNESESTVAVTGGSLTINYQNNSGDIVAEKIIPGWSATKSFTVTATKDYNEEYDTNFKIWYDMLLIVERNDFLTGSLEYLLTAINSDVSKEGIFIDDTYKPIPTGTNTEGISMGSGYLPNDTASHTYNLSLRYLDRDEIDQTSEMEGKFYARVNVRGSDQAIVTVDLNGGTLSNFSLDSSNKSKIAKNSEIYIPAPMKEGYTFNGWEIVNGTGTITGNNLVVTSSNITIKAIYIKRSFADDDWATIAANVRSNPSVYSVGSEKKVTIGGTDYTVRIANNSNYDCTLDSKTACGFVVEFVDIVEKRAMNSSNTNAGGWPATAMRTYLNGEFLAKLPSDLQSVIADSTVVSGHGSTSGETNFTSTDKLYLLSTKEVWVDGTDNAVSSKDTAYSTTRQLDYYEDKGVTTNNYGEAIKNYNGTPSIWWLRAVGPATSTNFLAVNSGGDWGYDGASNSYGLAPAFRIG